jgi:hypothetical protein
VAPDSDTTLIVVEHLDPDNLCEARPVTWEKRPMIGKNNVRAHTLLGMPSLMIQKVESSLSDVARGRDFFNGLTTGEQKA